MALMPRAIATCVKLAAPGHLLGLHRRAVLPPRGRHLACHRVHLSYVDTILAAALDYFKMTWLYGYELASSLCIIGCERLAMLPAARVHRPMHGDARALDTETTRANLPQQLDRLRLGR
jgi:hypothetical protein